MSTDGKQAGGPHFGLVCQTTTDACRYRTITRTRRVAMDEGRQREVLDELYRDNVSRLLRALAYCDANDIRLYRMPSGLLPGSDEPLGEGVLRSLEKELAGVGKAARELGVRVVNHPDQFVVLSSEKPEVVENSVRIMAKHALAFDLMGMERSPWAALILHGGKAGRGDALVETIGRLPAGVRSRLCLENDERSYSAAEILDVCRRSGVPMVFDNLHHAVHEGLADFEDPSFGRFVAAARKTWPRAEWQLVHLSNGIDGAGDARHSDLITEVPTAYAGVEWIEVEAKGKETAVFDVRRRWEAERRKKS